MKLKPKSKVKFMKSKAKFFKSNAKAYISNAMCIFSHTMQDFPHSMQNFLKQVSYVKSLEKKFFCKTRRSSALKKSAKKFQKFRKKYLKVINHSQKPIRFFKAKFYFIGLCFMKSQKVKKFTFIFV